MNDTRDKIVHLASKLIWSIGYNAFSYADISKQLNIKNAAIHYYFPAKSDLGTEIIKRNITHFRERIDAWSGVDYRQQYINYVTMHDGFIKNYWVCIVGSLSPSYDTLPQNMQEELQKLINTILDWLAELLTKGRNSGEFSFTENPRTKAYMIHSLLLSSLLMSKVLKNDVYETIQRELLNM